MMANTEHARRMMVYLDYCSRISSDPEAMELIETHIDLRHPNDPNRIEHINAEVMRLARILTTLRLQEL